MLQKTICTQCGNVIMVAPGYCMLCGQSFPQVLPALMSDFSEWEVTTSATPSINGGSFQVAA